EVEGQLRAAAELDVEHVTTAGEQGGHADDGDDHARADEPSLLADPVDVGREQPAHGGHGGGEHAQVLHVRRIKEEIDDGARAEQRGEQRRDEADAQGHGEALDVGGGGVAENQTGEQRGDVAVDDGGQRLVVSKSGGGAQVDLAFEFLTDALENEHVGV